MNSNKGVMSCQHAMEVLSKYDHAFDKVREHFPGAEVGMDILKKADQVLLERGCNARNTLYAQSVCPDEINHESDDTYHGTFSHAFGRGLTI